MRRLGSWLRGWRGYTRGLPGGRCYNEGVLFYMPGRRGPLNESGRVARTRLWGTRVTGQWSDWRAYVVTGETCFGTPSQTLIGNFDHRWQAKRAVETHVARRT